MVRKKNQGFSLIEVIVAVAILTILMAPIIKQVIQTLQTSAQAKERQYAVENAEYILNTLQETPVSKLNTLAGKLGATPAADAEGKVLTESIDGGDLKFTSCVTNPSVNCFIWQCGDYASLDSYLSRTPVAQTDISSALSFGYGVPYSATTYTLEKTALGRGDKFYQRKVTVDNLRAVVAANDSTIETYFSEEAIAALKDNGFTITTEGAAVKYDATTGLVSDIVVSKVSGIRSPNGTGTSYMQDLDSSKVAIIQGSASNFDAQAENDLYNLKMNRLKASRPDDWVQAMLSHNGSVLETKYFFDNVSKMTRISIVSGYDTEKDLKYYDVDCTVFYEDYLIKASDEDPVNAGENPYDDAADVFDDMDIDQNKPETLTYNAYTHRFYTNQAPDIYLVYEPYVASESNYATRDYIVTYDGVLYDAKEKHSKLYVIKPSKGRVVRYKALASEPADWSANYESYFEKSGTDYVPVTGTEAPAFEENKYYQRAHDFTTNLTTKADTSVDVYLNYLKKNTGETNVLPIYTNVDLANFKCALPAGVKDGCQYSANLSMYYGVPKSVEDGPVNKTNKYSADEMTRTAYDSAIVKDIHEDVTLSDRVYTVTVQLDKLNEDGSVYSGYSVKLSGAKGAE